MKTEKENLIQRQIDTLLARIETLKKEINELNQQKEAVIINHLKIQDQNLSMNKTEYSY